MKNFKIVPLSKEYARQIRQTGKDEFGYCTKARIATAYGPCRVSLKPFVPGKDERILCCYSPFEIDNAFNERGPIFINKEEVEPYSDIYNFPAEMKADKVNFPLSLLGYNKLQEMVFTRLVGDDDVDELITEIFNRDPEIEYLHARNAEACCFICKIARL